MSTQRPSMGDIAEALGISKNAVSLALAGKTGVSSQTREAVQKMAGDLGYHRRPRTGYPHKLRTVALVFAESLLRPPATLFFGPLIQSLQKALAQNDCSLTVFGVSESDAEAMRAPAWPNGAFEGILALSSFKPQFIEALQQRAPVVWVDHYHAAVACDKVVTENRLGAYLGVEHLIGLGYQRIGFMGNLAHAPGYVERWEGYRLAIEDHRLPWRPSWIWMTADENSDRIAAYWNQLAERPQAWFCVNDILAVNLLQIAQRQGLSVPEDVAIVGFDDLQLAQTSAPTITSLHVDVEYYAMRAVEVLISRLEHPGRPAEILRLAPFVAVRESSGSAMPRSAENPA